MNYEPVCAPTSLAACVIKFERPKRRMIETFRQLQAGRAYIELCAGDEKLYWEGSTIVSFADVTIESEQLEDIMESVGDVELPEPYPRQMAYFMGRIEQRVKVFAPSRREVKKRAMIEGAVTVADIAAELGKDVRKVRAYLRDKIEKPAQGWQWPENEVDKIKKLVAAVE